jgi:hypothetical protein
MSYNTPEIGVSLGVRFVTEVCQRAGLPAPKACHDYGYELRAEEVRRIHARAVEVNEPRWDGEQWIPPSPHYLNPQLYLIGMVLHDHACDYIYGKMVEADEAGLQGRERREFLRKATKAYRLYFS